MSRSDSLREKPAVAFGPFRLFPRERLLEKDGVPLRIGGRALDILIMLVERPGEVVDKRDLLAKVWADVTVDEGSLRFHVRALRQALGDEESGAKYVKNVPGRGYCLAAPVSLIARENAPSTIGYESRSGGEPVPALFVPEQRIESNLPVSNSALVGRAAAVQQLSELLSAYRTVTLTGPGGIGKTVLALEVARRLVPSFEGDACLVELASLSDPALAPSAVAGVLGLKLTGEVSSEAVARTLARRKLLLVLDNCEHVVDATAGLVETLAHGCPNVTVLATSREPLRIDGEFVYRVAPLEVPPEHLEEVGKVLEHSAVKLFIARTSALHSDFATKRDDLTAIASICRHLDGIPLAIEFAAARAATLGPQQVALGIRDRFSLLTSGRRTALTRHQTLRATLDWSYEYLPPAEQRLLRRLAVFAGGFTIEAATAVGDTDDAAATTIDGIANLVSKSLIALEGPAGRWRLLETIRAYALEKLTGSGEAERVARRHAEYYRDLFARAEAEALARPTKEWLADYAGEIDNLRSGLDWAFSPGGDISVGIALTAAAVPLWVYLSLIEERRRRVERALAALAGTDARLEMKLQAALGASLGWIGGAVIEMGSAWTRTLELAESLGDVDHQLRALWGLWLTSDRDALALAQQFSALASTPADRLIADQMVGCSYHWRGNQSDARRHLERVIANKDIAVDRIVRFHLDQQPASILARVLWLQGLPDQAMAMAERLVEHAKADDHANSLCHALAFGACPIALWAGNLDLAERYTGFFHETSSRHNLTHWHPADRAHRGVLLLKRGDLQAGLPQLRAAFEELRAVPPGYRFMFIAELAESLAVRQMSGGLATIEEAIDRAEHTAEGWIIAELLRIKGELLRLDGALGAADSAENCFRQALQLARTQDALSWELRAATSMARLLRDQHRSGDAAAILRRVYSRFTEGFDTADLKSARELLEVL